MVTFSSDSLSEDASERSLDLFSGRAGIGRAQSGFDSNVELLLDGGFEYSDVFPSSDATCSLL